MSNTKQVNVDEVVRLARKLVTNYAGKISQTSPMVKNSMFQAYTKAIDDVLQIMDECAVKSEEDEAA